MRSCTVRLLGCQLDRATTVFAHAPSAGKGISYKSPDWWGADACSSCHDLVDRRKRHPAVSELDIAQGLLRGIFETISNRIEQGLIIINE